MTLNEHPIHSPMHSPTQGPSGCGKCAECSCAKQQAVAPESSSVQGILNAISQAMAGLHQDLRTGLIALPKDAQIMEPTIEKEALKDGVQLEVLTFDDVTLDTSVALSIFLGLVRQQPVSPHGMALQMCVSRGSRQVGETLYSWSRQASANSDLATAHAELAKAARNAPFEDAFAGLSL